MEHSPSDGVAVVSMSDFILTKVLQQKEEKVLLLNSTFQFQKYP
jgi:hypothetical protein